MDPYFRCRAARGVPWTVAEPYHKWGRSTRWWHYFGAGRPPYGNQCSRAGLAGWAGLGWLGWLGWLIRYSHCIILKDRFTELWDEKVQIKL